MLRHEEDPEEDRGGGIYRDREEPVPPGSPTPSESPDPEYKGFGAAIQQQQDAVDDRQSRVDRLRQSWSDQMNSGQSIMSAFLDKNKPTYDQGREDRLRKGAMIMALGNILGAAFGGAVGHYNKPNTNSLQPLLGEMLRMQQEYQRRGERWKDLEVGVLQREQAEREAQAQRDYERELGLLDRDKDRLRQLQLMEEQGRLAWEQRMDDRRHAEEQAAKAHQQELELIRERGKQNRLTAETRHGDTSPRRMGAMRSSEIEQMYVLGKVLGLIEDPQVTTQRRAIPGTDLGGDPQYETITNGVRWESMDPEQKLAHLSQSRDLVELYNAVQPFLQDGLSIYEAIDAVREFAEDNNNQNLLRLLDHVK